MKKRQKFFLTAVIWLCSMMYGWAQTAYAVFDGESTLTFKYDNNMPAENAWDVMNTTGTSNWSSITSSVTRVVFESSFADARPRSCQRWFQNGSNLVSIEGLNYLNTSEVTNMSYMFYNCSSLKSLDLRTFNTANVTDMRSMFYSCSSLEYILIGEQWNTDKVGRSSDMFHACKKLEGEYGNWVGSFTLIDAIWTETDKTHANAEEDGLMRSTLPQTTKKAYAQYDGAGTLTFKYDENMPTQNAWDAASTKGNYPEWLGIATSVTKVVIEPSFANARPNGCVAWFNMSKLTSVEGIQYLNTSRVRSMERMFMSTNDLTSIDLSGFNTAKVKNMERMFEGCLCTELDLSSFNTAEVVDMELMFQFCRNLLFLDLSSFNTAKVKNMWRMFESCKSLKRLNLGSFNTAQVTNMGDLFCYCNSLQCIWIGPEWNTEALGSYGNGMFIDCKNLIGQDGTKVGEITDYTCAHAREGGYMREVGMMVYAAYDGNGTLRFCYDKNMPSENAWDAEDTGASKPEWSSIVSYVSKVVIDPSFAQARPRSLNSWFMNMKDLASIEGLKSLNTTEVDKIFGLFNNCNSLTEVDLSSFDTQDVTTMGAMFYRCSSLKEIDLSSFDTWNVTNMSNMFSYCTNLESIYIGEKWNVWRLSSNTSFEMFVGCTSLVGEYGATVGKKTDKTYAHANEGGYMKMKTTDGIEMVNINSQNDNKSDVWYDLQGRRLPVNPSLPGLYIRNNQKIIVK